MSVHEQQPALVVNSVGVAMSGVVGASWLGWLPPIVAFLGSTFALIWYAIQIWESRTIRRWRLAWGWSVPPEDG
jgi:hypothetical protein